MNFLSNACCRWLSVMLVAGCTITAGFAADESLEPPLRFEVQIGEKTLEVSEGQQTELLGAFQNPLVRVTPLPHRVFSAQGISFRYARSYVFEANLKPDLKLWTITGNDAKIMFYTMSEKVSASAFADQMVGQFGAKNSQVIDRTAKIVLGESTYPGATLRTKLAGSELLMDIYDVAPKEKTTKLLIFQDSLGDDNQPTREAQEAVKLVKESFRLQK